MPEYHLKCTECGQTCANDLLVCPECSQKQEAGGSVRGALEIVLENLPDRWPNATIGSNDFLLPFMPITDPKALPPLTVGGTPLLTVPGLREAVGCPRLFVKDDIRNPSGSTKDRASHLVVTRAREIGATTISTASTGNAATALAAVAASTPDVNAVVFVPAAAPVAKLTQMLVYGARLLPVEGTYDDAFELCVAACKEFGWYNRNTATNPFTTEGKKTASLEIAAQIAPEEADVVFVPTGDGVIISGVAKGFDDLLRAGLIQKRPRLIAVQPEGSSSITKAWAAGDDHTSLMAGASSVADSLTVEMPRNGPVCLSRIRQSEGAAVTVNDDEIVASIAELSRLTGVFAEPSAAIALPGLRKALEAGYVERDERIVLLITGTGLKDVPAAGRSVERPANIPPRLDAVVA